MDGCESKRALIPTRMICCCSWSRDHHQSSCLSKRGSSWIRAFSVLVPKHSRLRIGLECWCLILALRNSASIGLPKLSPLRCLLPRSFLACSNDTRCRTFRLTLYCSIVLLLRNFSNQDCVLRCNSFPLLQY